MLNAKSCKMSKILSFLVLPSIRRKLFIFDTLKSLKLLRYLVATKTDTYSLITENFFSNF